LGKLISEHAKGSFPVGTFLINITGAFLLGIVSGFTPSGTWYLLFGDGFLGAYTTFSTFMYEGFHLFEGKKVLNAMCYIAGSLLIGMVGYILGVQLTQLFV
jgi:CrcB protein